MAQQKKPFNVKGTNIITFKGEAEWCKYLKKSLDTGQYNPRGKYSVNLLANPDADDFKLFQSKIEKLIDQAYQEALDGEGALKLPASKKKTLVKAYPWKEHITKEKDDDGNYTIEVETGKMVIQPKLNNVLDKEAGKDYVKLIGGDGREVPRDLAPEVGNGSIIQCKVFVNPYYMATTNTIGVSLTWSALRIIELKEFGGENGEDFDTDDEAYTAEESPFDSDTDEGDY